MKHLQQELEFLRTHLPQSDLDCYPPALLRQFAAHAAMLRQTVPWCADLEQEVFDHYVLFPRVNDEDLSFHRAVFYEALWPRVRDLPTMEDRILAVNRWCQEMASYQPQDQRTASPLTVFYNGSGRCGEESAFLVAALRSVGIPARQVYAPRWAHCDDNHAWVEALCGGQWRFLGACEPEPVLDRGWFNTPASRAILVHSRTFGRGRSAVHGEFLCREGGVCWYNQTARYAPVRLHTFRALRKDTGAPAADAVFQLQVLNEAGFHTIASLTADGRGEARAALGMGSLWVLASQGDLRAEGLCSRGGLTLYLEPGPPKQTPWTDFDVHAPQGTGCPTVLDEAQKARRAAERSRGDALRQARLAAFEAAVPAGARWAGLLRQARGNRAQAAAFLERDADPRREALLRTLADKDLRDLQAEILEDHLQNTPRPKGVPEEVYNPFVLCPRIQWEPLTAWRGTLSQAPIPPEPADLWHWLPGQLRLSEENTYANLVWTPAEAWRCRRCDFKSLRLLYVALLRAHGVPARLRPLDGMPEYWQDGSFHPAVPEETGRMRLTWDGPPPVYGRSWTLSRWTCSGWQLLSLPDGGWSQGVYTAALPAGVYRLVTAVRLPNGSQLAARRELVICPGTETASGLHLRPWALEDMLGCQPLPVLAARTPDGEPVCDLRPQTGRPALLLWLEPGGEPTEHVLTELAAQQQALRALPVEVVLLLPGRESLAHATLARLLDGWPELRVLLDDWRYDLELTARCLTCDPDTPPLTVVCDGHGRAVYGASGYRAGAVELLARIAGHVSRKERS